MASLKGTRYADSTLPCCGPSVRVYLRSRQDEGSGTRTCKTCGRAWAYTIRDATARFVGTELEGATAFLIAWKPEVH